MKHHTHFTLAACLLLALLLSACSGFLEENPRDAIGEDQTAASLQDLYRYHVATLYTHIGGYADSQGLQGTGRGVYDLNTFTTDEAIMPTRGADWYDGGFWQGLYLHRWGVSNNAIFDTWEYLYQAVVLCNRSLEKIDAYAAARPADDVEPLRAEVRALRALFYYYIMDLFGRVPLLRHTDDTSADLLQVERSELFRFIVTELQQSLPALSGERSNQPGVYYGRVTRPVAWFLLAKLALNAEVYTDDDWTDGVRPDGSRISFDVDGQTMDAWQTVCHYCDLITGSGYRLEPDYGSNFAVFNESSAENIFVIPMSKTLYTNQFIYLFRSRHYNHAKALGLGGENGASATLDALDVFGYGTDGEDPRFRLCYYADEVTDLQGNPVLLDDGRTPLVYRPRLVALDLSGKEGEKTAGARMKKYEVDPTGLKDGKLVDNDIVLFRYADVLLMKSEARVRAGGNGDAELEQVRGRVGAPSRPATLETLLDERLLELAWEGWRRQDLIRFGRFTRAYSHRPQVEGEATGFTTVFPIPEQVIGMNPHLKQNRGY